MEIIPDPIHVALLTLPFLVAVAGGHFILWKPLMDYLEGRDDTIHKAQVEADELQQASADQTAVLEERLRAARHTVTEIHAEARSRALAKEASMLAEARKVAEGKISEAVQQIGASKKVAAEALTTAATDLSRDIAGKVLGRDVA